jgi:hypothetical protein
LPTLLRRGGAARGTTFAFVFGGFDFLCGGVLTEIVDWKHIADWDLRAIPRSATTLQPLTENPTLGGLHVMVRFFWVVSPIPLFFPYTSLSHANWVLP